MVCPDMILQMKIISEQLVLKTATGKQHWCIKKLISKRTRLEHQILVMDIVDGFILGLDLMGKFRFVLNIKFCFRLNSDSSLISGETKHSTVDDTVRTKR